MTPHRLHGLEPLQQLRTLSLANNKLISLEGLPAGLPALERLALQVSPQRKCTVKVCDCWLLQISACHMASARHQVYQRVALCACHCMWWGAILTWPKTAGCCIYMAQLSASAVVYVREPCTCS